MWGLETSKCRGEPHLKKLDIPSLVIQGTSDTGVFPSDAARIHAAIRAVDKRLDMLPGAHYFEDFAQHRHAAADVVSDWIRGRI